MHGELSRAVAQSGPDVNENRAGFDRQQLLTALLTYGEPTALPDAAARRALRLTSKSVRDLVDAWAPPTFFHLDNGRGSVTAALDSLLATSVTGVDLAHTDNHHWLTQEQALKELVSHPRSTSIQKLSTRASTLDISDPDVLARLAALPSLNSLSLSGVIAEEIADGIDLPQSLCTSLVDLSTIFGGYLRVERCESAFLKLSELPRLARLTVLYSGTTVPFTKFPKDGFSALEELSLMMLVQGARSHFGNCKGLLTVTWPSLRRFTGAFVTQEVLEAIQVSLWAPQLTYMRLCSSVSPAPSLKVGPLLAALSGTIALRQLSLHDINSLEIFSGVQFPCLQKLVVCTRREEEKRTRSGRRRARGPTDCGVLADLLTASVPMLNDLTILTDDASWNLAAPIGASHHPFLFPLLRRLEVSLEGLALEGPAAKVPTLPASHVIPLQLMATVEKAEFSWWTSEVNILEALPGIGGPAWPVLRELHIHRVESADVIDGLRAKAAHFPALRELWLTMDGEGAAAYNEVVRRVKEAAASGCWPDLKLVAIKAESITGNPYPCVWWA